jgi:hypothetical protein
MDKGRKNTQIAIRWQADDIAAINKVAEREERSRSEIVRFFVRWGIEQYNGLGSILALQLTSIPELVQKRDGKQGKLVPIEKLHTQRQAIMRLELLREAQVANVEQTGSTDSQRPKKTRAR